MTQLNAARPGLSSPESAVDVGGRSRRSRRAVDRGCRGDRGGPGKSKQPRQSRRSARRGDRGGQPGETASQARRAGGRGRRAGGLVVLMACLAARRAPWYPCSGHQARLYERRAVVISAKRIFHGAKTPTVDSRLTSPTNEFLKVTAADRLYEPSTLANRDHRAAPGGTAGRVAGAGRVAQVCRGHHRRKSHLAGRSDSRAARPGDPEASRPLGVGARRVAASGGGRRAAEKGRREQFSGCGAARTLRRPIAVTNTPLRSRRAAGRDDAEVADILVESFRLESREKKAGRGIHPGRTINQARAKTARSAPRNASSGSSARPSLRKQM